VTATDFIALRPDETGELSRFLSETFGTTVDAPFLEPRQLFWKYHHPRPDWIGGRSFVLKNGGNITAHGGVWPIAFSTGRGEACGIHVIDWAGAKHMPGAGVLLLRRLLERTDFLITIGGSAATRAILPRIGYELRSQVETFARVLRPWQHARRKPQKDWRAPLRLARNLAWSAIPVPRFRQPWRTTAVQSFDVVLDDWLKTCKHERFLVPRRSAALLNYMLACPGATITGFQLYEAETLRGYFLLSRVGGQARIADLLVNSEIQAEWIVAVSAALECAKADDEACELVARPSIPLLRGALLSCGFRLRFQRPVFVLDPKRALPPDVPLYVQMMDGDAAFHDSQESAFVA
jgi:hypothetical protein